MNRLLRFTIRLVAGWALVVALPWASATPVVTPWNPIYKGVEHLSGTNHSPGGDFENLVSAAAATAREALHDCFSDAEEMTVTALTNLFFNKFGSAR